MNRRHVATLAFSVSVALGLCHALCYSTVLPDQVAAHFDTHGQPLGSMARSTMIDLQLTVIIALAALFAVAGGAVVKSPRSWFGMPDRAWWMSGDREESTRFDLSARVLWLGALSQLLAFSLFHRTVRVNMGRSASLEGWYADVAIFLGLAAIWLLMLRLRYRRRPASAVS